MRNRSKNYDDPACRKLTVLFCFLHIYTYGQTTNLKWTKQKKLKQFIFSEKKNDHSFSIFPPKINVKQFKVAWFFYRHLWLPLRKPAISRRSSTVFKNSLFWQTGRCEIRGDSPEFRTTRFRLGWPWNLGDGQFWCDVLGRVEWNFGRWVCWVCFFLKKSVIFNWVNVFFRISMMFVNLLLVLVTFWGWIFGGIEFLVMLSFICLGNMGNDTPFHLERFLLTNQPQMIWLS